MILFKAKLTGITRQLTRLKISFATKDEIDELVLEQMKGIDGWLAFNEDEFKKEVEEKMADRKIGMDAEGKTKSQKFRGILFSIWNKTPESDTRTFEQFYSDEYNRIMEHYINKYLK